MYIKKKYQGALPQNAILNTKSESELNTYSCKYIDNNKEIYSLEEQVIGAWNGKPLYRKIFTDISMPSATTKTIATGLTNANIVNLYGSVSNPGGNVNLMVGGKINDYSVVLTMAGFNNLQIITYISNYATGNYKGYVVIEYTKTTD